MPLSSFINTTNFINILYEKGQSYVSNDFTSAHGSGRFFAYFLTLLFAVNPISADEPVQKKNAITAQVMDELVVTGSQIPRLQSQFGTFISTISREDIELLPARSISELLDMIGGIDVRQRGANGVQTDISLRGSSFEQVLILVDGINISDPQTGHHNMDLAVHMDNIERIEILKGPGARIYGQNAMAGVINIITRSAEQPMLKGQLSYGSYDYYHIQGSIGGQAGVLANRLSVSRSATDGHIADEPTDAQMNAFSYNGTINTPSHAVQIGMGLADKNFGAYKFYSDIYPDQREKTHTFLAYVKDEWSMSNVDMLTHLFWRRHDDKFNIRVGRNWFTNEHATTSSGLQINSRFHSPMGTSALGGEIGIEDLKSSNLGNHDRNRNGLFFEHQISFDHRLIIGFGTSALYYTDWGWQHWPGANINMEILEELNLFSSLEKSFRVPTYTELYYDTPANQGNPDLEPEKAWTYEIGFRHRLKGLHTQAGFFLRDTEDVIDWTRTTPTDPWQVRNIAEIKTQGYEIEVDIFPGVLADIFHHTLLNLSYTYLDADKTTEGFESKYALDHLKHQGKAYLTVNWSNHLSQSVVLRYEKRLNTDAYFVVNTRMIGETGKFKCFLDVSNLFDREYISNGFTPGPGRWIYFGLSFGTDRFK